MSGSGQTRSMRSPNEYVSIKPPRRIFFERSNVCVDRYQLRTLALCHARQNPPVFVESGMVFFACLESSQIETIDVEQVLDRTSMIQGKTISIITEAG